MKWREHEFLDSLIGKEVTITFTGGPIVAVKTELVWHDVEAIGVKFRKEEEKTIAAANVVKEKNTLIYKSAIQSIDSEWKNTK